MFGWIEEITREDEQFDADMFVSNTGDQIDEEVARRMEALSQRMEHIRYLSGEYQLVESELVAASRAWDAYDARLSDTSAIESYESAGAAKTVINAYWYNHRRYGDTSLEAVRPTNRITLDETAQARLDADRAAVISQFLTNDAARLAYEDSYRESCRVT